MVKDKACDIYRSLIAVYPESVITHHWSANPFENLVLTILSAQTTDRAVSKISDGLFSRFPTPELLSTADIDELEQLIRQTGFYHTKARNIRGTAKALVEQFNSKVPSDMASLLTLPGVGRKTANIVLFHSFGIIEGIAVDTHVFRLSGRLGLAKGTGQDQVETELMGLFPKKVWGTLTDLFIAHGRRCCTARNPQCIHCPVKNRCDFFPG